MIAFNEVKITIIFRTLKLDNNFLPNGYNDLSVVEENEHLIPKDNALGWVPVRIIGIFSHGVLRGYTVIKTKKHSTTLVMTRDGVLHGPCVIYGIQLQNDKNNHSLVFIHAQFTRKTFY